MTAKSKKFRVSTASTPEDDRSGECPARNGDQAVPAFASPLEQDLVAGLERLGIFAQEFARLGGRLGLRSSRRCRDRRVARTERVYDFIC